MKDYPLEIGYNQFLDNFNNFFNGKKFSTEKIEKSYHKEKIKGTKETKEALNKIKKDVSVVMPKPQPPKKANILRRVYRKLVRTIKNK